MDAGTITALVIPILIGSLFVEHFYLKRTTGEGYRFDFVIENLQQTLGQQVINIVKRAYIIPFMFWAYDYRVMTLPTNVYSILGTFILFDFLQYWFHRISHMNQFLWGFHVVHHSANEMNLMVSFRNPWFIQIIAALWQCSLVILGMDPTVVAVIITVGYILAFWVHAAKIPPMPRLERIIVTPSFHRVHHSTRDEHLDKNFGHFFSIWDHLFGTYAPENGPSTYGLQNKTTITNPLWQNTYYFVFLFRLMKYAPSFRAKVALLFSGISKAPEWISQEEYGRIMKETAVDHKGVKGASFLKKISYVLLLVLIGIYLGKAKFISQEEKILYSSIFILLLTVLSLSSFSLKKK